MNHLRHVTLALVALGVLFGGIEPAGAQTTFKVDPVHSFVTFRIRHMGVAHAWGRFDQPQGTVVWDDADPSKSSVQVTLQTERIDTGNEKRDAHLRSPDFFNARQFPTITFKSTAVTKKGEGEFEVRGDMTLLGVTKPVTAKVVKVGEADTKRGQLAGWDAFFTVKRSEFGMTFMPDGLGDEVTIFVSVEGVGQ